MSRSDYINEFVKNKYDRINLQIPKGEKDRIKEMSAALGISVNEYIYKLICEDLALNQSRLTETSLSEDDIKLLEKWQVAKKCYDMIEQCSFDRGTYYVLLKKGYINDITGSRNIICHKTSELRLTINKSHKVKEVNEVHTDMTEQLQKWQIPKKYHEVIESIGDKEIVLKNGYTNDYSGSNVIRVDKANEFRTIMKYTREI